MRTRTQQHRLGRTVWSESCSRFGKVQTVDTGVDGTNNSVQGVDSRAGVWDQDVLWPEAETFCTDDLHSISSAELSCVWAANSVRRKSKRQFLTSELANNGLMIRNANVIANKLGDSSCLESSVYPRRYAKTVRQSL